MHEIKIEMVCEYNDTLDKIDVALLKNAIRRIMRIRDRELPAGYSFKCVPRPTIIQPDMVEIASETHQR